MNEVKISVQGLKVGMLVSRLDRPWLGTPFPLQGFQINSNAQLKQLKRLCTYVFIDVAAGPAPNPRFLILGGPETTEQKAARKEIRKLRKLTYENSVSFQDELEIAEQTHDNIRRHMRHVMDDLRSGKDLDLERLQEGVDAMLESIIRNPSAMLWLKEMKRSDDYTYQHALGSAIWAAAFGRHLGLEKPDLMTLSLGGMLCDVGKIRIPRELLNKVGPLNDDEAELVRAHVAHSLEIVGKTDAITKPIIAIVATHHERHDGSGYPNGLAGNAIPIFGRIAGIVDSFDAMTSERPYAIEKAPHEAVDELYQQRDAAFQGELVEQFIQTCGIYPTGSMVELTDGSVAVVVGISSLKRLRPRLMLLLGPDKAPLEDFRDLDLNVTEHDSAGNALNIKTSLPRGAYGIDPDELFI